MAPKIWQLNRFLTYCLNWPEEKANTASWDTEEKKIRYYPNPSNVRVDFVPLADHYDVVYVPEELMRKDDLSWVRDDEGGSWHVGARVDVKEVRRHLSMVRLAAGAIPELAEG